MSPEPRDLHGSSGIRCWNAGPGPRAPEKGWSRLPRTPSDQRVPLLRRTAKCRDTGRCVSTRCRRGGTSTYREKTRREPAAALTVERGRVRNAAVQDRTASPLGPHAGLEDLTLAPERPNPDPRALQLLSRICLPFSRPQHLRGSVGPARRSLRRALQIPGRFGRSAVGHGGGGLDRSAREVERPR